jgi:hypothetical protein
MTAPTPQHPDPRIVELTKRLVEEGVVQAGAAIDARRRVGR